MSGFHQWMGTGEGDEDSCIGCGVVVPDFNPKGVMSEHGPVPIFCPDVLPYNAHHFVDDGDGDIRCGFCMVVITDETLPDDVDWECRDDNHPPIAEGHPNFQPSTIDQERTVTPCPTP